MNKKKISIFWWIAFCIIMLITSLVYYNFRNKSNVDDNYESESLIEYINSTRGKIIKLENFADVLNVSACLNKFYSNYYAKNITDDNRKIVYNMLADEYKSRYNTSIEDINSNVEFNDLSVEIYSIYFVTDFSGMNLYFVKGLVRDLNYDSKEFENIVVLDRNNNTFEVYLDNYLNDNNIHVNNLTLGEEYPLPEKVETNEFNSYSPMGVTMDDYAAYLFSNMRNSIIYNREYLESMLDENSNINSLNALNDFYNNNKKDIILAAYANYEFDVNDGNNIITCYDKNHSFMITFYLDAYSNFKFDLINID